MRSTEATTTTGEKEEEEDESSLPKGQKKRVTYIPYVFGHISAPTSKASHANWLHKRAHRHGVHLCFVPAASFCSNNAALCKPLSQSGSFVKKRDREKRKWTYVCVGGLHRFEEIFSPWPPDFLRIGDTWFLAVFWCFFLLCFYPADFYYSGSISPKSDTQSVVADVPWDGALVGPSFDTGPESVVVSVGSSAYLACRVRQLGDRKVSKAWTKERPSLFILIHGLTSYSIPWVSPLRVSWGIILPIASWKKRTLNLYMCVCVGWFNSRFFFSSYVDRHICRIPIALSFSTSDVNE